MNRSWNANGSQFLVSYCKWLVQAIGSMTNHHLVPACSATGSCVRGTWSLIAWHRVLAGLAVPPCVLVIRFLPVGDKVHACQCSGSYWLGIWSIGVSDQVHACKAFGPYRLMNGSTGAGHGEQVGWITGEHPTDSWRIAGGRGRGRVSQRAPAAGQWGAGGGQSPNRCRTIPLCGGPTQAVLPDPVGSLVEQCRKSCR